MKKWVFCAIWVLLLATAVQAQKTCTRVSPTSQNCLATISWTASVVDATHDAPVNYVVRRSDAGGAMTEIGKVVASTTSFENTFTDAGNAAHCWDIVAQNSGGQAISTQACWTTPAINATPPNTPGGVTIAAISSSTLRVTWDDTNNESSYEVYGRTAKGNQKFAKLVTLPMDSTTWDYVGRKRYTSYCVGVVAVNDAGGSPLSATPCATTSK